MNAKKIICLLLALLFAVPLLAACGKGGDTPSTGDTDTAAPVSDTAAPETESPWPDALPSDLDFDGAAFRTIEQSGATKLSFWREEEVGEKFSDAVYYRNRAVEERLHITIPQPYSLSYTSEEPLSTFKAIVQSGSDDYDVTINSFASARGSLLADLFHDWSDIPYMDLSQPWYNQGAVEAALNGRIYYLVGDVTPTYLAYTYLLLFNKNKAADYNVSDDLYQLVRDGKWTLDRMFSITENLYNDLDGDGKKSEEDFFGFKVQDNSYLGYRVTAIMYACETPYIRIEGKEIVNLVFEERCVDLLDKLCNMMKRAKGALLRSSKDVEYFAQGKALFIEAMANNITGATIVGMQDDFGVLPLPKYDEDQQEYHTTVDFTTRSFETLKTVAHKDLVGAVMEALSALSWRDVTPVYAEAVLEYRSTRDPESAEMMRLILDSRVVDFDLIYSAYSGWARGMHNPITDGPGETVSYLTRNLGPLTKEYDELLDYFFRPTE